MHIKKIILSPFIYVPFTLKTLLKKEIRAKITKPTFESNKKPAPNCTFFCSAIPSS